MSTICVFGDSITWGAVDPEGGGWATRLRNHFESEGLRVDLNTDVYNLGIPGDNSDDLKKRFYIEMAAREPDTIIFAIGINDSQFLISEQQHRVPTEDFKGNVSEMVSHAISAGCKVHIVGLTRVDEPKVTPLPWNANKEYRNTYIEKYDSALREIANTFGLKYIDVSNLLENSDLADGLHPNSAGHQKMFQIVKDTLRD